MLVTLSVCDRGEAIYSTKTNYPYEDRRSDMVPKLEKRNLDLKTDYVNNTLGLSLKDADILKLLKKARYDAEKAGARKIRVTVPCYRVDVMHQVDLVEDIAMMFGYNNIAPRWPELITFGGIDRKTSFYDLSREAMIGLGFQEVLTFSMTDKDTLFSKMNLKESKTIDIANPMTNRYTTMRNSLLPNLMGFLSNNTHASYPQKVFEVGRCVTPDKNSKTGIGESMKLAGVIAHANASFTEAKAVLDAFFINMGVTSELKEGAHGSFIDGRIGVLLVGGGEVGLVGELHPQVIENWKLENPVSGFELDLDKIIEKNSKYNR